MHRLRPIRESDLEGLQSLAASVTGSLTTLPNDRAFLARRIVDSLRAFDPRLHRPAGERYLFVLEDSASGSIVGTSGIVDRVGGFDPFYSYAVRREPLSHPPLRIEREVRVLHLRQDHKGPSEICSLFLSPDHRRGGLGRLLSLGRFLFLAAFPSRFDGRVIAELRGWQTPDGRSPFWESVGRHFFGSDFHEADFLSGLGDKEFIAALMPRYPIYLSLLPTDVQAVIGRVHPDTEPALRLLLREGFAPTGEVDIFDAGPLVSAPLGGIRTVAATTVRPLSPVPADPFSMAGSTPVLASNRSLDFRAVLTTASPQPDGSIALPGAAAAALEVAPGDPVATAPLAP